MMMVIVMNPARRPDVCRDDPPDGNTTVVRVSPSQQNMTYKTVY